MRFSRDYRFWYPVPYFAFCDAGSELLQLVRESHPASTDFVLSCEDHRSYVARKKTTVDFEESPDTRVKYSYSEVTRDVWISSQHIELFIKDETADQNFMVTLSVDRRAAPHRLVFYAQCIGETLEHRIRSVFAKPRFMFGIGSGYTPPTRTIHLGSGITINPTN